LAPGDHRRSPSLDWGAATVESIWGVARRRNLAAAPDAVICAGVLGQLRQGEAVELPARFPLKGRLLDRLEPEPGSLPLHTGAAGYRETVRSPSSHLKIVSRSALVRPMTKPF